jgi:hypothetical protein
MLKAPTSLENDDFFVAGPGMRLRHRAGCDLARNKPVVPVSVADCDARGLGRCGMCGS